MTTRLARRDVLKGFSLGAGGLVLQPFVERLARAADGELPPTRFLFVVEGNGVPPRQLHPEKLPWLEREARDKVAVHALSDIPLPPALAPVEPFKDRLAIIQGLSGRMCTGGHSSDHGALGAYYANSGRNIVGPTIDGLLGRTFPGIFSNVVLGIASDAEQSVIFNCSADAPGRSLPTICRPDIAYSRLFGSVAEGEAKASFSARRNLLDYMQGDVRRVRNRLGSVDREKFDSLLGAYESLSKTSERLVGARERLQRAAPTVTDKYASAVETDRLDAHFDLAAASMIGGLTNVATIASGVGFPYFNVLFNGLGIELQKHQIGHLLYNEDDRTGWELAQKIRAFHFGLIARFMQKLNEVPEGDGTMLDNTVVVYLSDAAETHHSRCFEWPMVVLGGARGKLKTGGRYIQLPDYGKPNHRTINTLYNTLLYAAGKPRDDFGSPDPNLEEPAYRGPLAELS
ncbi:MAG: DUF1552 domain-containing protein [Planctomycetia bacterium]|nr:DUF1552 domain-containing protein [Planctomycetia bacterium]